jgi:hypothetical protein
MMDVCKTVFNMSPLPPTSFAHDNGELELMLDESIFDRLSPVYRPLLLVVLSLINADSDSDCAGMKMYR